jgi:CBS domain containing-hemolysin-like protein
MGRGVPVNERHQEMNGGDIIVLNTLFWYIVFASSFSLLFFILSILKSSINSLSNVAIRQVAENRGEKYLYYAEKLYFNPSEMRIAIQLSRQIALICATFSLLFLFTQMNFSYPFLVALLVSIVFLIIFIEQLMARLFVAIHPKKAFYLTLSLLPFIYIFFFPLIFPLFKILDLAQKSFGESTAGEENEMTEEDIQAFIDVGEKEGILEEEEGEMVKSIVDFGDTMAREVMTPRTDMVAIELSKNVNELRELVQTEKHSRIPVFKETIDNIVGIVYIRDLMQMFGREKTSEQISDLMRPAYFVPETKKVSEILKEMQTSKIQMAIVVDEYGGTAGIVTIEDLLEEIVGEIQDVHELEEEDIVDEGDRCFLVKGSCNVEKMENVFGQELEEEDFDTVGGLVFAKLGRIPSEGESLKWKGLQFTILSADKRRIRKVRVKELKALSDNDS